MSICIDRYEYLPWNDNSEYLPGKSGINVYLERPIFTWNDRYILGTTYFYLKELIYTWNDLNLPEGPGKACIYLDWRLFHLLNLERVDDPYSEVTDQKEGYNLSTWLGPILQII